jgi:hypothetical protein
MSDSIEEHDYTQPIVIDRGLVTEKTKEVVGNGSPEAEGDNIVWVEFTQDSED